MIRGIIFQPIVWPDQRALDQTDVEDAWRRTDRASGPCSGSGRTDRSRRSPQRFILESSEGAGLRNPNYLVAYLSSQRHAVARARAGITKSLQRQQFCYVITIHVCRLLLSICLDRVHP